MKKRVRVYQRGGFNAFDAPVMPPMRVAQNGVNVQQPQYSDEQLVSAVMSIIGEQGGSPEDALQQLVSAGIDQNKANAVVSSAIEYINQQGAGQQQAQQQGPSEEEQAQAEEEARAQEQQQEEADRQARYNAEMANDEADLADSEGDIDAFAAEYIMRNGGALPSKRSFVKNVMKLTKKGTGGAADDTDIPDGRKAGLQAFVGNLKGKANGYLQEQDAKAMYEMMAPLANESDIYGEDPEMQFGGMRPGQQRRLERRANRMAGMIPAGFFNAQQQMFPQGINIMGMPSMMPGMGSRGMQSYQMPSRGLYEGGPRLANIEVHKTGLFGRPKQWTATFDNSRGYDPDQWMRDMARMNQVNQQTEYEDVNFDHSEEATNTSTAENAEVANEEAETQTNGGDGTGGTKPKPDTGDDVNEEVDERSGKKPAGDIPKIDIYEPWKGAMQDQFDLKYSKPYVAYVDSKGNVLPDKKGSVGTKQYYYNSRTNKWSNIDGDINDKDRLARLNNWKKTERLHPGHAGTESTSERLMSKPQSAMADDEFITNAVMSGVGIPAALRMAVPGMINIGKPTEQLPPGNNQGLSGAGVPPSVKQALGPGANPRLLGTGKAPNVPSPPASYGMKPTISDMGSNRMFEPEPKKTKSSKSKQLSAKDLNLKSTDRIFSFDEAPDDNLSEKSVYLEKNGKLYKSDNYSDSNNTYYEITDPKQIANIQALRKKGKSRYVPHEGIQFIQMGGMTDQQSGLYRFMGGGEDMSIPTLNERNTADPYFAYGGYFAPGGMVAVNDANGNRKYVTEDEADAWNSALKDNADLSLKDMSWASESPRQNPNYKTWDDLKDKGVNVGDFREGIDYSRMGQGSQGNTGFRDPYSGWDGTGSMPWITSANAPGSMYGAGMYNPQIGAMYPPLFGGRRRFGPPGGVGYAGSWLKQQGMPFDPRTGQMLGQMPTDLPLTKLDVTKSSLLRKRPKEYTMYFGNYGQLGDNLPKGTPGTEGAMRSEEKDYSKRNRFAEGLMHTPGLRKLGAKLYKQPNQPLPEGTTYTEEQMPSLPLRPIGNIPTGDLVPDQYNNANQPGLSGIDMTGLPDSPIPEITPEEFSFEDQQRFGNIQGPLNQTESTGIGQLPMRSLSNIPTQYDDQLMANNFNYSPEGLPKAADIDELQRFIPQPQGAITEEDYANQLDLLGFPDNAPVMKDINGNAIQPGQGTPMNIAGPMSDMSNLPDEQGYFNDLQLEQNQEQRIAGLPPESASYDYYQDVMQPNRDQSMYPMGFPEGITPDEYGQYAQENLDSFNPMRMPDESGSAPQPFITQNMVNAQQAQIRAEQQRRMQEQQRIRAQREAQERAETQSQESNAGKTQQVKPIKVNSKGVENYGTNLNYDNINAIQSKLYRQGWNWDEIGAAFDEETGVWDPAKAEKFRKESRVFMDEARKLDEYNRSPEGISKNKKEQRKLETKEIKSYGVPEYAHYQTKNDLFKAMQAGHVKTPLQKGATGNELRRLGSEYENWLITQDPTKLRREGGQALPKAQFGPTTGRLTTNPDLVGFSDIDLLNSQTYPEVSGSVNNATGDWWSASPNMPTVQDTGMTQPEEMNIDPNQQYTHQMKREYDPRGAAVKFKVKDMYNVDFEKGVNQLNAGINFGLGALGEVGDRDRRAQMFNNLNSGIYGSTKALKRGTYEANSGLLEPDKKGFKGVIRDGGNIKRQGGPAYKTGGVTYMSADQVKKFLAEGGELEFV